MRFPDDGPSLSDGVVTLRAPRETDVPGVVEQCRDPESLRWTTVPADYTEDDAREFVTGLAPCVWRDDSEYLFAVEADRDGVPSFAGSVSLRMLGDRRADIGYGA